MFLSYYAKSEMELISPKLSVPGFQYITWDKVKFSLFKRLLAKALRNNVIIKSIYAYDVLWNVNKRFKPGLLLLIVNMVTGVGKSHKCVKRCSTIDTHVTLILPNICS